MGGKRKAATKPKAAPKSKRTRSQGATPDEVASQGVEPPIPHTNASEPPQSETQLPQSGAVPGYSGNPPPPSTAPINPQDWQRFFPQQGSGPSFMPAPPVPFWPWPFGTWPSPNFQNAVPPQTPSGDRARPQDNHSGTGEASPDSMRTHIGNDMHSQSEHTSGGLVGHIQQVRSTIGLAEAD